MYERIKKKLWGFFSWVKSGLKSKPFLSPKHEPNPKTWKRWKHQNFIVRGKITIDTQTTHTQIHSHRKIINTLEQKKHTNTHSCPNVQTWGQTGTEIKQLERC